LLITAYLRTARDTGNGAWIDAAMVEGVALLPNVPFSDLIGGAPQPGRGELALSGELACYDVYQLLDGEAAVGALEPQFWNSICDVVDELDERRDGHMDLAVQDELRGTLRSYFSGLTKAQVVDRFGDRDCCVTVVQSWEEMLASEQAAARTYVSDVPGIPLPTLAFPAVIDGERLPEQGPAPKHDEHGDEIRRELAPIMQAHAASGNGHGKPER
jgi:alpha-methylacyl-CoA racemase